MTNNNIEDDAAIKEAAIEAERAQAEKIAQAEQEEEQEIERRYEELIEASRKVKKLTAKEEEEIQRAYQVAKKAHHGVRRKSGEPYIFHPLAVAKIAVEEIGLGPIAVIAALLHDVVEDTEMTLDQIRLLFGERVATIVDGVTKIEEFQERDSKQAVTYRKILLSMCNDTYVIFLKLCDRLHNMRTLGSMRDTKKLAISSETQYLFIPLAHRLGLYAIKTELEELVMRYTNPDKYAEVTNLIAQWDGTAPQLKECLTKPIEEMLQAGGYKYRIMTRVKSVYSCWKKMENKGVSFDEIYDLFAMRIILDVDAQHEKEECFKVYALISSKFRPNPTRFRDWITTPKSNGYESLQTTVMTPIGRWVEIQIRTERMDRIAERGMAAHFLYKETHPEEKIEESPLEEWLQQIRTTLENTEKSATDLVDEFKETLYTKEIYVFTPKGETIKLPSGSTVLDFAFAIHSDLGLHCIGAKVNAKVVPTTYRLNSGEQIQVLTSRHTDPKAEWLDIVRTSRAKESIKDWLREQKKAVAPEGQRRLTQLFLKLHQRPSEGNKAKLRRYANVGTDLDLYYQVATGKIGEKELSLCFGLTKPEPRLMFLEPYRQLFEKERGKMSEKEEERGKETASFLLDKEYEDYPIQPATCCKPIQGDQVIGLIADGKIEVHRTNCQHAIHEMANHESNVVRAKWHTGENVSLLTAIALTAIDRKGLLQELTHIITQDMDLNMRAITLETSENVVNGIIMLYINDVKSLNRLVKNLTAIEGVEKVRRI